jgi:hypothetical protein
MYFENFDFWYFATLTILNLFQILHQPGLHLIPSRTISICKIVRYREHPLATTSINAIT